MTKSTKPEFLEPAAVARMMGVSTRTLQRYRAGGEGPPWCRLGPRLVRYEPGAVKAYMQRQAAGRGASA